MKIYLTESQYDEIFKTLSSGEENLFDEKIANRMLSERYDEIISRFSENIENVSVNTIKEKLSKLMTRCMEKERNIRPMLEKLCAKTVFECFDIPDGEFDFKCNLVDSVDPGLTIRFTPETEDDVEYDDVASMDVEKSEVYKRKMINCLVTGGSLRMLRKARKLYLNELFDLDEELPHLYNKIMYMNEYLLFKDKRKPSKNDHMQSGMVNVSIKNGDTRNTVDVKACIFPILLFESFKGVFELVSSNGLPDDYESAKRVIGESDALVYDPYNMKIGPVVWDYIFASSNLDDIPDMLYSLVMMDAKEFKDTMLEIGYKTKKGRMFVDALKNDSVEDSSDFEF